jgi:hypothetical protein
MADRYEKSTLHLELAKLSEQAAAVERTIEEHRRERDETQERYEAELARANKLAERVEKHERDALLAEEARVGLATTLSTVREALDNERSARERLAEESAAARGDLERTSGELATVKEDLEGTRKKLAETQEALERTREVLAKALETASKMEELEQELERTKRDLESTRSEHEVARSDLEHACRARDAHLERLMAAEKTAESGQRDIERLERDLEAALSAQARAEIRANASDRSRTSIEENVKQLRDEMKRLFVRWASAVPAEHVSEAPPATRRASMPPPKHPVPLPESVVEEGWSSPPAALPGTTTVPPIPIPPIPSARGSRPDMSNARATRPEIRPARGKDSAPPRPRSVPPRRTQPPPIPPSRPSSPSLGSSSLPPSAPISSGPPGPREDFPSVRASEIDRVELFDQLAHPDQANAAATILRERPEWLRGRPPIGLVAALASIDYDVEAPIFDLARAWEREPMCRAVVAMLREEPDSKMREHAAWLLKHLGAPSALPSLAEMVMNEDEPPTVRRWLLEAIERLVASRAVGFKEVGDLVQALVRHEDATIRDGVIGIIAALDRVDEKKRLLVDLLRTDDDEMVLASAVHALASVLPLDLDASVSERLLGHSSQRVQRSVMELLERSKRAAPTL